MELLPLLVIGGGFAFAGAIIRGAWLLGRYRGREDEVPIELATLENRLARVEYVLSQTTGALDRLEAAHRQIARLITEMPNAVQRLPGRAITPH
jgi:hypothetical protein